MGGWERRKEGWGVDKDGTRYLEVGVELVAVSERESERERVE